MQIVRRETPQAAGDGLGHVGGRLMVPGHGASGDAVTSAAVQVGLIEPSSRISLSADALMYLGRARRPAEKIPALTPDEWSNILTPQLAAREQKAFGKYAETGDFRAYYRNFIDYFDNLRVEDQNSLRYFGTREAALAGLRSFEYSEESGMDAPSEFKTLVSDLLDADKAAAGPSTTTRQDDRTRPVYGWDFGNVSYESHTADPSVVSGIDRLYSETF